MLVIILSMFYDSYFHVMPGSENGLESVFDFQRNLFIAVIKDLILRQRSNPSILPIGVQDGVQNSGSRGL